MNKVVFTLSVMVTPRAIEVSSSASRNRGRLPKYVDVLLSDRIHDWFLDLV
jgi:hypothetical protein